MGGLKDQLKKFIRLFMLDQYFVKSNYFIKFQIIFFLLQLIFCHPYHPNFDAKIKKFINLQPKI